MTMPRARAVCGIALVATVIAACSSSRAPAPVASVTGATSTLGSANWPGYHVDQARSGALVDGPSFDNASVAWNAKLGGAVRGQAVAANGVIIAATENNRVTALNPGDGRVLWSDSLGTPLTNVASVAGCGNIDPLGITSTPVIDTASGRVYVVGEVSDGHGTVHHQLEGIDLSTGAVVLSEAVDPPLSGGEQAVHLLQRAGLALGNGRVYVGYGGNIGDCGRYHGWLVGVNETGPPNRVSFEVAADGEGGAIWQSGGAPALDPSGNVYVSTGNANPDPPQGGPDPKQYTESVLKLSPDLTPLASFKDVVAGGDEDLSTGNPVLLPNGTLFAIGKTDVGFVLSQRSLAKVAEIKGVCGSDPDGGPAYDRASKQIFVPCRQGGIQVVNLANNTLGPKLSGADSAPIVLGSNLWALDHDQAVLSEFEVRTGRRIQSVKLPSATPIFTSPSVGAGLLLVPTVEGVIALH